MLLLLLSVMLGANAEFTQPKHADGVTVANFARHDLPPIRMGGRINDLVSGVHFDNLMQDTPDELRPPSIILFHGFESCPNARDKEFKFQSLSESKLPSRERLMIAEYDMDSSPKRAWFKFTPEMDLAKRMGVTKCGTLAFVPRNTGCDGFTRWCEQKTGSDPLVTQAGCEDYESQCQVQLWDEAKDGNWVAWVQRLVKQQGEPEISPVLGSYADQNQWLRDRDYTTNDNEMRNYFLVEGFPAFTKTGFLAMPTPKLVQDFFVDFWNKRKATSRRWENWHAGSTQMSFHDTPTTFVALDQEAKLRDKLANEVLKPIVEKWSGMPHLELTSFYGLREYKKDSWLRGHIDRIDTHVLSITFVVGKANASDVDTLLSREEADALPKWPLEVYAYDGNVYRHEHPPGTMILYESSKLIHGRPYKNKGPDHLGAFAHFKPVNADAKQALSWDKIAAFARQNQEKNTQHVTYRASAVVEPAMPKFSQQRYGDGTGIVSSKDPSAAQKKKDKPSMYNADFVNDSDETLTLMWVAPKGQLVEQGTLAPKASVKLQTHLGHKFQWVNAKTKQAVPQGKFEIEAGSRIYKYQAKLN
ncbi:hypothetical protein BASA81_005832 [Batrachochytrium salamandrivorans]|nr:hypothetical protein BASA81_005832 [Batrachochytrium salamandrivorans]